MNSRILLVEDEPGLVLTLSDLLASQGYDVQAARDGPEGLRKALTGEFELLILDVMLPGMNGFELCKQLRQRGVDTPVMMLTARTQVIDRVLGLKLGADDYVSKPFDPTELAARVEALLRRVHRENLSPVVNFQFGNVQVDFETGQVLKDRVPVSLAGKELQLLRYLVNHRGKVVARDELMKHVWEYQPSVSSRTVDVHVAWLRQKLEDNPQVPRHFHTIRGVGYRFSA